MATLSVSTATTTTQMPPNIPKPIQPTIRFDSSYAKTVPGILKIAQAASSFIGFICIHIVADDFFTRSASGWFIFVALTAFWLYLVLIVMYLFHMIEKFHWIPWLVGELGFIVLWAIFYLIAASVVATKTWMDPAWAAGAFFGYVCVVLFVCEAFIKYKQWKSGALAQGERPTVPPANPTPVEPVTQHTERVSFTLDPTIFLPI